MGVCESAWPALRLGVLPPLQLLRGSDTVSRHGGDEFVVLLTEMEHAGDAAVSATKLISAVTAPLHIAGHEIHLTVSVGISVYPDDGEHPETLIRSADIAMYHAKMQGPDAYLFFKAGMNVEILQREFVEEGRIPASRSARPSS